LFSDVFGRAIKQLTLTRVVKFDVKREGRHSGSLDENQRRKIFKRKGETR